MQCLVLEFRFGFMYRQNFGLMRCMDIVWLLTLDFEDTVYFCCP